MIPVESYKRTDVSAQWTAGVRRKYMLRVYINMYDAARLYVTYINTCTYAAETYINICTGV